MSRQRIRAKIAATNNRYDAPPRITGDIHEMQHTARSMTLSEYAKVAFPQMVKGFCAARSSIVVN
jgi:hypothetical protein